MKDREQKKVRPCKKIRKYEVLQESLMIIPGGQKGILKIMEIVLQ